MMRLTHRTVAAGALLGSVLTLSACTQPEPAPELADVQADQAPLSRLTNKQYNNTVRDLFAPVRMPLVALPQEKAGNGGLENNEAFNTATTFLVESYRQGAEEVSRAVAEDFATLSSCNSGDTACSQDYLLQVAERAFRRPLSESERASFASSFSSWESDFGLDGAIPLMVQLILQDPSFLYFERFGIASGQSAGEVELSSWEVAERLSYFFWDTLPDDELRELAARDALRDRDTLIEQAWRLLSHPRARRAVVNFHRQVWAFDQVGAVGVDLDYFIDDFALRDDGDVSDYYHLEYLPELRGESDVYIVQHVFEGEGTLSALLSSTTTWTTDRIAQTAYGVGLNEDDDTIPWMIEIDDPLLDEWEEREPIDYARVELDPAQRAGIFTMAGFLSSHTGPRHPSPVSRGVRILDRLLCTHLDPPGDVPPLEESTDGQEPKTNRDKYEIHTTNPACANCHEAIDGVGFTFEQYDALGRYRTEDNGYPVDATGLLVNTDQDGPVNDAVELMTKLSSSRTVHDCYVDQWLSYALGRDLGKEDETLQKTMKEGFWDNGGDIPELMVSIAASRAFRFRRTK